MLIDSNIIVYALNADSPKYTSARNFLLATDKILYLSHQNILETYRVLTHPKFSHPMNARQAMNSILGIAGGCQILSPNTKTYYFFLELLEKYKPISNHIFDTYLVATALSNDIDEVATDNIRDLQQFSEITITNPFN